jgi:hypothetical protein
MAQTVDLDPSTANIFSFSLSSSHLYNIVAKMSAKNVMQINT